jgi:2-keto-4-pentenoate hydratase
MGSQPGALKMNTTTISQVAQALIRARLTGQRASTAPWVTALEGPAQAYAVQVLVAQAMGWHGDGLARHWKSGGPKRDGLMTHAGLPPQGIWAHPAHVSVGAVHLCGIEAEIALRLGCDVTPAMAASLGPGQGAQWIDGMAVAIELIDTRWDQAFDTPAWLKLADVQVHGGLVLADWQPLRAVDWAQQVLTIEAQGRTVAEHRGTHPLGEPLWGVAAWCQHATAGGQTLGAGTVVTTGSWNGIYRASPGDLVRVVFEGLGEASIQL